MRLLRSVLGSLATVAILVPTATASPARQEPPDAPTGEPIVIGHRGAPGYRPEHTLAGYQLAIDMGADYIEPDLVSTKDGVLVARHENEISQTTDVEAHPEFAARRTTKVIDGVSITGWFTEDFTLAELKTLRAEERIPDVRPQNTVYNGLFEIPTFQEVLDLVKQNRKHGREIGVYPETKHPTYFDSIGLSLEEPLVETLRRNGLSRKHAPVFIQSFEVGNLVELRTMTKAPIVQLLDAAGRPYDFVVSGDSRTYADMATPEGLAEIATYANGIGANKNLIVPRDPSGALLEPTSLIEDAHDAGLVVHGWTFRNENTFLPLDFRQGDPADPAFPRLYGDAAAEYELFFRLGIDGVFSDNPDTAASDVSIGAEPVLLGRAILPSDAYQPGPPSGALVGPDNGVVPPFPGQPIPGFSAVLDVGGGDFLGMPDNGYGAKTNSSDFLLRLYRIRPDFRTAGGGTGSVEVGDFLQLSDPDEKIPFALTRSDRLLTGADFDLESVRRAKDGSFWFGEEFGPFLLHTDATGKVLEAPIPLPGVQSPQNPFLPSPDAWTLPASRGFEGTALSTDGKFLYPILEGALRTDPDPRRRVVSEFDIRAGVYTGQTWQYRVDADFPNAVIGDFTALDKHRFVLIERDDDQGAQAAQKKIYLVDLRHVDAEGFLEKRLVLDLLHIADPDGISLPERPGEFGVGDPFSFPLQSVESLEVLGGDRLLIANDNNYPGSDGRSVGRDRPDDTELIVVRAPALR